MNEDPELAGCEGDPEGAIGDLLKKSAAIGLVKATQAALRTIYVTHNCQGN